MSALEPEERETYAWQLDVAGFGEAGQEKLRDASVLVSRCGGLGGVVAYELAAAGVGKLVVAHAGNVKRSDLNRQLLMTHDWLGKPRIESIERRLRELNPRLEIEAVAENPSDENAARLVEAADMVVDCAPLFEERLALNAACVEQRKPMVECAMWGLEGQITTIVPGETPCLACLVPAPPQSWTRRFPVFGAVSCTVGGIAAMEAIKLASGLGAPLCSRMLTYDLRTVGFRSLEIERRADCAVCSGVEPA